MPVLARVWQMLLKGLEEVQAAPSPIQAAEMVLVRLAYVADLPVPAELVRSLVTSPVRRRPARLRKSRPPTAQAGAESSAALGVAGSAVAPGSRRPSATLAAVPRARTEEPTLMPPPTRSVEHDPMPQSFAEVVAAVRQAA